MQKLIIALAAILMTGVIGAFSVPGSDAQDAWRERGKVKEVEVEEVAKLEEGQIVEVEMDDARVFEIELVQDENGRIIQRERSRAAEGARQREPQFPLLGINRGQPGTWQMMNFRDSALLLNTATGETFVLQGSGEGIHWQPIGRPGADRRDVPRGKDRPDAERPMREQLEQKLEQMRKRLKESEGERREQAKRAIEELEQALEKLGDRKGDRERNDGADRERRRDQMANQINEIEEKIGILMRKAEETDSKREARKYEEQINELRDKAKALSKELKGMRD